MIPIRRRSRLPSTLRLLLCNLPRATWVLFLTLTFAVAWMIIWRSHMKLLSASYSALSNNNGMELSVMSDRREKARKGRGKRKMGDFDATVRSDFFNPNQVPFYRALHEDIDGDDDAERCNRYGFESHDTLPKRRRIFMGSLIADDSWDTLRALATESYGIYHTVAFVESNATQEKTPRKLRFVKGSDNLHQLQDMFGPDTKVTVDMFVDAEDGPKGLPREQMQRELIVRRWKANGMTAEDIGCLSDTDETFTRDFLRAAQVCDVPVFQPGQNCQKPKLMGSTLLFEGSPECIYKTRRWYHPDMIIGECIDGIGDTGGRPIALRETPEGLRKEGYGRNEPKDYSVLPTDTVQFPLWNGGDFRQTAGGRAVELTGNFKGHAAADTTKITAFHFHNFFTDLSTLRHKYLTYGHPIEMADKIPLDRIHGCFGFLVRCLKHLPDTNDRRRFMGGFTSAVGPMPLYFMKDDVRRDRHEDIVRMVVNDQAKYGTDLKEGTL